MAKKQREADPELREVWRICKRIKTTQILRWKITSLETSIAKLQKVQSKRGGGLFGCDFNPEINFLVAAIALKRAK